MNIPAKIMPDLSDITISGFATAGHDDPNHPPARLGGMDFKITFRGQLAREEQYDLRYILTNAMSSIGRHLFAVDVCMVNILHIPGETLLVKGYQCAVVETIEDISDKVTSERTCAMPFNHQINGNLETFEARMGLVNCRYSPASTLLDINFATLSSKGRESFRNNPNIIHNSAAIVISGTVELSYIARDFEPGEGKPRYRVEEHGNDNLADLVDDATGRVILGSVNATIAREAALNLNANVV